MRKPLTILILAASLSAGVFICPRAAPGGDQAPSPAAKPEEKVREIFVPFEDLHVLLEGPTQRVLLSRKEYEELLAKAKKTADSRAPREAILASADYAVTAGDERAEISGALVVSVMEDGLHALGLDAAGVGLRTATLDGKNAPIGLADDGRLTLFVEGKGQHKLVLEMVAPIQTTAARQILNFRLPMPAAARLRLTVPGDVEVKSGAPVVTRVFDEKAGQTRLELLPPRGDVSLVMTLNSRLKRRDRIVVARSVLVDEVTAGYERLHATVSMAVLHRAVDQFRFAVPAGFEVTDVRSPALARWAMATEGARCVLDVQLREETTDTVVLNLSAIRTSPNLAAWALPRFEPLDVVGHVAVVCLAVEDRLKAEAVASEGLIPIDTSVLAQALPATVLEAQPGDARLRPVVAYYAPQPQFGLTARFVKPPARLRVVTNLLAILEDGGLQVRGGFALVPEEEKLFGFDFSVPAGWDVTSVTGDGDEKVAFERYGPIIAASRIHVRLPGGVPAGTEKRIFFTAIHTPKTWFSEWSATTADFPVFAVADAVRDEGAIAVDARDDMTVRPETLERLTPLDENEKTRYGLAGVAASLAYRYEGQPYKARLAIERTLPRVTAQTYSFFRIERDALAAHYEIVYDVARARTRSLSLVLPKTTPTALLIRGLGGVTLKEFTSEMVGQAGQEQRRWTALLAERRSGTVRLAVDFEQRLESLEPSSLALPVVAAGGVAYQSGLVAVEGSPELDVQIAAHPRKVDIGELVDAEYQPGRRLLGAYGFVGDPPPVRVSVARHPAYGLPPAVIQRAELATVLSADRMSQTAARFLLRTKALFLEVKLPKDSVLWAAALDSKPIKPQREADSLLVNLPAVEGGSSGGGPAAVRDLRVVYETPVGGLGFWRGVSATAPRLALHAGPLTAGEEVPVADLQWIVYLPTGYKVVRAEGSMVTNEVAPPTLALASMAGALWYGSGGVDFDHGALGLVLFGLPRIQVACKTNMMTLAPDHWKTAKGEAEQTEGDYYGLKPADSREEADETRDDADKSYETVAGVGGGSGGRTKNGADTLRLHGVNTYTGLTTVNAGGTLTLGAPGELPATSDVTFSGAITTTPATPASGPAGEKMVPLEIEYPKGILMGVPRPTPPVGPPAPPAKKAPAAKAKVAWALEGFSSLTIDLHPTGQPVTFRSLGTEPKLALTIVDADRLDSLAWGLALAVLVVGMALTTQPVARKAAYVVGVGLVATLVPVITGKTELAMAVNGTFYAACLLIPYYLAAGAVRWFAGKVRWVLGLGVPAASASAVIILAVLVCGGATAVAAEAPYVIQVVPPPAPVKVPDDALILPYDPASQTGIKGADRLLVPYERFVALWNLAYPEKPIGVKPPPAPYALAGAAFTATLKGDEYLLVEGTLDLDVYTDGYAVVPLPLDGGVLAKADLDGKPARLSVTEVSAPAPQAGKSKAAAPPALPRSFVVLYALGKGRHRLDVAVRMRLEKRGGWRVTEGRLPAAPATALTLSVPDAGTEIRLGGVPDRRTYETKAAGESIKTALGVYGDLSLQWRPKVSEGQIDQTLTADSTAVLDVQEDALRLAWSLHLEFRHGEREFFSVEVPPGYMVEKVEGQNVRGWEMKPGAAPAAPGALEVSLLKRAKESEDFSISLWRQTAPAAAAADKAAPAAATEFEAPVVGVTGALRHSGLLVIRRSPLLDLRTVSTSGVTRTDLPGEPRNRAGKPAAAMVENPLNIRPYQAYQFVSTPFVVRMATEPVKARVAAEVQMILRVSERERNLEARTLLKVENRPLYRARFVVPADLKLERVLAPGNFEWALTGEAGRKVLTVYLASGVEGLCPIVIQGKLGEDRQTLQSSVPRLEVLDVDRQQGDIVVQVDPAFDVRDDGLENIERVLLERVFGWLKDDQRGLAQLALHYTRPDYAGRLTLAARKADVTCFTVTNARVTDRSIEEAVLVAWTIKNAGIREVVFLLPAWMKDAKISVPLLRQKTVTPVSDEPGAPVRVRLELQDEVMDELRVLVENDRLLAAAAHDVAIPVVETGRTDRRYVAVESAGRDEVMIEKREGLEPLSRQQKEWEAVAGMLRGGMTQAFIVAAGAEKPRLEFRTKERAAVETAGARIGLAQTVLVLDSNGAYRAEQTYRLDNRTEQFLEIQMPQGAALWTAIVAGEPVKPTLMADPKKPRHVQIPIVKTAAGDLDYAVVLKYGGTMEALGAGRVSVAFPLIRTVNINAELSQVQLYVPETHAWFDFRGTMRRVTEEGDLEAGILAYENKLADRLVQTLRSDNPFARTRALSNLGSVSASIKGLKTTAADTWGGNTTLQAEVSNAGTILQNVEREITLNKTGTGTQVLQGNNDYIGATYLGQRNRKAKNLVAGLIDNWSDVQQPPETPQVVDGRFNQGWLSVNRLETVQAEGGKKDQADQGRVIFNFGAAQGIQTVNAPAQPGQPQGQQMFQQFDKDVRKSGEPRQEGGDQQGRRQSNVDDLVQRYQQKLEKRAEEDKQVAKAPVAFRSGIDVGREGGGFEGLGTGRGSFSGVGAPEEKAVPAGLASLDVQLPVRGVLYRFTTPRGEVEITACAASMPLIEGLERVGGVAALIVVVLLVRRRVRGLSLSLQAQSTFATVLIILGVIGMLFGVFPVAGLVAAAVGVGLKVRLFFARRRPAAA